MGNLFRVLAAAVHALALVQLVTAKLHYGFPYGKEPVRGVSLGGWLVIEVRYTQRRDDKLTP